MKFFLAFLMVFCLPVLGFGFGLDVTSTTETCSGNGTLTFNSSNVDPSGSIEYFIYKLPNTLVPYATTTANSLGGLTSGNYRVVAVETVGASSNSQQQDATISNAIVPLEFTVQSINQACAAVSNISVVVTSGTAVSYEIFEGPRTFTSQTSNIFNNLQVGVYKVRVFDACGIGVVSTFTVTLNPTGLSVTAPVFSNTAPPSCNFTVVSQTISPSNGTVIAYPVSIRYTVNPPNGALPIVSNQTLTSGNPSSQQINAILPTFNNQNYTYDLLITDACNTIMSDSFVVSQLITLSPTIFSLVCNTNYFELNTANFTPPFTLNFTSFPVGFDPSSYNAAYPGPYNASGVAFGDTNTITPLGSYTVSITDSCAKTKSISFDILDIPALPTVTTTNNGCLANSGQIVISIPNYELASAVISSAPADYPFALPHDVSSFIDGNGVLTLPSVPIGDYTIILTDFCNSVVAPVNTSIATYTNQPLLYDLRPGCELQKSSIKITSGNRAKLTSIVLTAAPNNFPFALPYDGSQNITVAGDFYMNNWPEGAYEITAVDECGFINSMTVAVAGYAISNSLFLLQSNCGTFDLELNFASNGTANQTFWLQKLLDPTSNVWGHPITEVLYTEASFPDNSNSFPIANNATNYNLAFNGIFRIVRSFDSYQNGSNLNAGAITSIDKNCVEILEPTFEFNESLEIINAYRMPCTANSNLDVIIEVNGALPLHFTITERDGVAFTFDNGTSNIFYNLAPAIYTFQVEDNCGNIVNRIFDVAALGSLINITKPDDLLNCADNTTGNVTFDLQSQNDRILGMQSSSEYTLNYYSSLPDAQSGTNAILNTNTFSPTSNPQTIYATLRYNLLPNCYESTSFDLYVGQIPEINLSSTYLACGSDEVVVNAQGNNLSSTTYMWSNGSTSASVAINQPGITVLTLTATNSYGPQNLRCSVSKNIEVTISKPPSIDRIETVDWTEQENSIAIVTDTPEQFEYALNNASFQSENAFTNLAPGLYTVFIRDKFGCGVIQQQVWLLYYPKFFTPNGDGYNDLWFIENADFEPDFKVFIYDRYGKLIHSFGSKDTGWNGMYNGRDIFSNDYWFVVHRQDGKVFKGHFTLKR
ncbi:MAG: T9SS type B sorting domain-containing protein [Burkholderiales bacterium]|nr:T9SS type B sorting domain-containing protein [Flavobacterium sp.]